MCRSLVYYPLVKLNNEKQQILFKEGVHISNVEEFEDYKDLRHSYEHWRSNIYLRNLFHQYDAKDFIKFVQVPCGHCDECLKDRARQWAVRIMKESEKYYYNYFITLTYDDDNVPLDYNLIKSEISDFNKRLKSALRRAGKDSDFRFYGVGEYGSHTARPHYHVIYFNLKLDDLVFYKAGKNGDLLFNSPFIDKVWKKGFCVIGAVDIGSASYVARYVDKKRILTKEQKEDLLAKGIQPEFSVMSRRPGIGADYISKINDNLLNGIYTIPFRDNNYSIPKFYKDKLKDSLPDYILEELEDRAAFNMSLKFENDIKLNSLVGGNLDLYNKRVSTEVLSQKKRN